MPEQRKNARPETFLKYSGLAFTMATTIGVCLGGGYWLDQKLSTTPWITLVGALIGVFASLYLTIKELSKP